MNSQNNEDSINFSVIDKPDDMPPCLDFSIPELLEPENTQPQTSRETPAALQMSVEQVFSKIKKMNVQSGRSVLKEERKSNTFLEALERMEKELSFQTESYNIYEQNPNFQTEIIQNNKSKTLSCLKTNKSTNPSAHQQSSTFNDYFGPLIIDFKKKEQRSQHSEKDKKQQKMNKSKSKSGSQISIDRSEKNKAKQRRNSKSRSKEDLHSLGGLREKSKSSKNYLLPLDFKKSKNKANVGKRSVSKSHSNLKPNTEADTYASKVFTQYYGTDVDFKSNVAELKQKKQQGLALNNIKSREKSKSKTKLGLLSPRGKVSQAVGKR